jgi:hypothetical protein
LLPVPDPIYHQVVSKPNPRSKREILKNFTLLTPPVCLKEDLDELLHIPQDEEKKEQIQDLSQNQNLDSTVSQKQVDASGGEEQKSVVQRREEKELQQKYNF